MRWAPVAAPVVLLIATSSFGGEKPLAQRPVFGAGVTIVTLPVFVSDKSGQPITGLKPADFEVRDDGHHARLVGFQEVDAREVPSAVAAGPTSPAAQRQFLLLFDLSFTSHSGLLRARRAAMDFVEHRLGPTDLVGVATFSVFTGMQLVVAFTTDRQQAAAAVAALGSSKAGRTPDPLHLAYDLGAPLTSLPPVPGGRVSQQDLVEQDIQLEQVLNRGYAYDVKRLMEGLSQLAQALDAVEGRKQVIYLSAGFRTSDLLGAQGQRAKELGEAVAHGELWNVGSDDRFGVVGRTTDLSKAFYGFALADAIVHTVDVTGLVAAGDVSQASPSEPSFGEGEDSLNAIARGSGGQFFKNANELAPVLQEILDSTHHFYVLAFEPAPSKGIGKIHRLKVKVKASRAEKVSHRTAYAEAPPAARGTLAAQLQAAEALAKGLSGGEIEVHALALPYRLADGRTTLPVVLQIDGPSLLDRGTGDQLPLEIYGYALDANGRIEDAAGLTLALDLAKAGDGVRQRGLMMQTAFAVEPGTHTLRFLVLDGGKHRRGSTAIETTVPDFSTGQPRLSPPIVMDEVNQWMPLRAQPRSGAIVESPFQVDLVFFAPSARPRLANEKLSRVFVLSYEGESPDAAPIVEAAARLMRNGADVPLSAVELLKSVSDGSGYRRFVLGITPQNVPPGDYRLVVSLKDSASGQIVETEQTVTVQ